MPTPSRSPRPMYRLKVGGKDGITPSLTDPTSYLEVARCGDGTVRVSIHVYLDPLGGETIPPRPIIINGVPQYLKGPDGLPLRSPSGAPRPALWPESRLLGETTVIDSLQTVVLSPLLPTPIHIGAFARVTLARTPSLEDALDKYRVRDTRTSYDLHGDPSTPSDEPPFIPSQSSALPSSSLLSHNLPTPPPPGDPS